LEVGAQKQLPELTKLFDSFSAKVKQLIDWDKSRSVLEIGELKEQVRLYREAEKIYETAQPLYRSMICERERFYSLRRNALNIQDANNLEAKFLKTYNEGSICHQYNKALSELKISLQQAKKNLPNLIFRFKTKDTAPVPYLTELARWLCGRNYIDELEKTD
jgi:hypothetical protein